ncbi:MAG TPA: hypothetical protein VFJ16_30185 [Longimicrobium sp.]|nr:hypothetical protein [Longimicrobium sp.]
MAQKNLRLTIIVWVAFCGCSRPGPDGFDEVNTGLDWFPTWETARVRPQTGATLHALWVRRDGKEGWAVGSRGTLLHLADGHWTAGALGDAGFDWNAVAFDETGRFGVAVGNEGRIATFSVTDSGWRILTAPLTTQDLRAVWVSEDGVEAFAVGHGGTVLRFNGGEWTQVPVRLPPASRLADVAVAGGEVWVRDSATVTAFSAENYHLTRRVTDFGASRLWGTRRPASVWVAGVSHAAALPAGSMRYSVRRYHDGRVDSVTRLPQMPRAAAFSGDAATGIVVAREEQDNGSWLPHATFVNRMGRFQGGTAASPEVRALWLADDASDGWAVGDHGYVARLRQQRPEIRQITGDFAPSSELTGWFVAQGDLPVGTTLDSIRLVAADRMVRMVASRDFKTRPTRGGVEFSFLPAPREAAVKSLNERSVRLQLYFGFPGFRPRYTVGWTKSRAFAVGSPATPWKQLAPWLAGALLAIVLLVCAWRIRRVRTFLLDPASRELLGTPGKRVMLLVMAFPGIRRRVLDGYRARILERYPPVPPASAPPHLLPRDGRCNVFGANTVADPAMLQRIYPALSAAGAERVLWLQDAGIQASALVRALAGIIAGQGGVPVYLHLAEPGALKDVAARALGTIEEMPAPAAANLLEAGGYVFLVDCIEGRYDAEAVALFVADMRVRNHVIVASHEPPRVGGVCHVSVAPAPEPAEA